MGISITATTDDIRKIAECTYEQADKFNEIVEEYEEANDTKILPEGWGYGDIRMCLVVYDTIGRLVVEYNSGDHDALNEWAFEQTGSYLFKPNDYKAKDFAGFDEWINKRSSEQGLGFLTEEHLRELDYKEYVNFDAFIGWRVCSDGSVVLCDMSNH